MRPLDLAFRPDDLRTGASPAVRVRWLGTAGFELSCEGERLLIDPYLTRASLGRCLAGPLVPVPTRRRVALGVAQAILVSHTHFDHALDVPACAVRTGATVVGSPSAMALCRSAGIEGRRLREVAPAPGRTERLAAGPFDIEVAPGEHSPLVAGHVPFSGDIRAGVRLPLWAHGYRAGPVLQFTIRVAGRTIGHLGSAALAPEPAAPRPLDLLLLCASGWYATRGLPERVATELPAAAILLMHWDDFFRPLHRPVRALPGLRLPELVRRLRRARPLSRLGTLPLSGEVWL